MRRLLAAALSGFALCGLAACGLGPLGSRPASAQVECFAHCDFTHDYGPLDLTYKRPGLYGFPRCGPHGNCSPYLSYSYPRQRYVHIGVRSRSRPAAARQRP